MLAAGHLAAWFTRWRTRGLNLLFPPRCAYCDADLDGLGDDLPLCTDCRDALAPSGWVCCLRCGAPVPAADAPGPESCDLCEQARLRFDTVISLGPYRSELGKAVLKMKQRDGDLLAAAVGRLYCHRRGADVATLNPDLILPVPMHWRRRLDRGINSPDILAECLARHVAAPMSADLVVRCRNTEPQASLRPGHRAGNVRGAFRLRPGYELDGIRAVLVDDILTTGATCSELAGLLKRAGASMVAVAVVARGTGDEPSGPQPTLAHKAPVAK
jgi:ComF family protein